MAGTGEQFRRSIRFAHCYEVGDPQVEQGSKSAGQFKSKCAHNAYVQYLMNPSSDKEVDTSPSFINCTDETVYLPKKTDASPTEIVQMARQLKRKGTPTAEAMETLADVTGRGTPWALNLAVRAFEAQQSEPECAFMPPTLALGDLSEASVFQKVLCQWIEAGPVEEADGRWLVGTPGIGKTTALKILLKRHPGQTFIAYKRAATGLYDETSLVGYRNEPVVIINDLKGRWKRRDGKPEHIWPDSTLTCLKNSTDGFIQPFNYAAKFFSITVQAKILVCSIFHPPEDEEIARRCRCVEVHWLYMIIRVRACVWIFWAFSDV